MIMTKEQKYPTLLGGTKPSNYSREYLINYVVSSKYVHLFVVVLYLIVYIYTGM